MGIVEVENIEVTDSETEIIGATEADHTKDKNFSIQNGDTDIEAKAYSSPDGTNWTLKDTKMISGGSSGELKIEWNMNIQVKLTGRCIESGKTRTVDAKLEW